MSLVRKVEQLKLKPEHLDERVRDLKLQEASDINSDGLEEQLNYIMDSVGLMNMLEELKRCANEAASRGSRCVVQPIL